MFLLEALHFLCCLPISECGQTGPQPASTEPNAGPAHGTELSVPDHLDHCHARNDTDALVWPRCLACVVAATGGPWCVKCVCPAKSATLKNVGRGGGGLGNLACPFNSDGWSLKTTFPWQQTASLLYPKSLEAKKTNKRLNVWLQGSGLSSLSCISAVSQSKHTWVEPLLFIQALISYFFSQKCKHRIQQFIIMYNKLWLDDYTNIFNNIVWFDFSLVNLK